MLEYSKKPFSIVKDGIRYHSCPNCFGRGKILSHEHRPSGLAEMYVDCDFEECDQGFIEDDIYLILKLEGKI